MRTFHTSFLTAHTKQIFNLSEIRYVNCPIEDRISFTIPAENYVSINTLWPLKIHILALKMYPMAPKPYNVAPKHYHVAPKPYHVAPKSYHVALKPYHVAPKF